MGNLAEISIDFYDYTQAKVRVNIAFSDEKRIYFETMLFCSFILRHIQNLHGNGLDKRIAKALLQVNEDTIGSYNISDHLMMPGVEIGTPQIVSKWGKGKRGFDGILNMMSRDSALIPVYQLNLRGFDSLGSDINFFVLQSINVVIQYFVTTYSRNRPYAQIFIDAARLCGEECLGGDLELGALAHGNLVNSILGKLFTSR